MSKEIRAAIFAELAKFGIKTVVVCFDGSGDSGQIEDIVPDPEPVGEWKTKILGQFQTENGHSYTNGQLASILEEKALSVQEAIETVCYELLQEHGVDWYNNDGGYGELLFNVAAGTVSLDMYERITETNYSGNEWNLEDSEPEEMPVLAVTGSLPAVPEISAPAESSQPQETQETRKPREPRERRVRGII